MTHPPRWTRGKGRPISFYCYSCKEKVKDPQHFEQHLDEIPPDNHRHVLTTALTKRHEIHKDRYCYCRQHTNYGESYCRHCEWEEYLVKRKKESRSR